MAKPKFDRKRNKYRVQHKIIDPISRKFVWRSKYFTDKQDAEAFARESSRQDDRLKSGLAIITDIKFAELVDLYCKNFLSDKAASYNQKQQTRLNRIKKFFGNQKAFEISPQTIKGYKEMRRSLDEASNKTIENDLYALSGVFTWGVENKFVSSNPVKEVEIPPRLPTYTGRALSSAEVDNILRNCSKNSHDAVWLLVNTGIRLGELFQVSRESFDFANGLLVLRHTEATPLKGRRDRSIPVNDDVLTWASHMDPYQMAYAHGYRHLQREFSNACAAAKTKAHIHDLRHTWITNMLRGGVPLRDVQEYAGHASIETTQGYLHASGESHLHRNAVKFGMCYIGAKKDKTLTKGTFSCTNYDNATMEETFTKQDSQDVKVPPVRFERTAFGLGNRHTKK